MHLPCNVIKVPLVTTDIGTSCMIRRVRWKAELTK